MHTREQARAHILEVVTRSPNGRVRPVFLGRTVLSECDSPRETFRQALGDLIRARKLVYTYRDPCSFVETPPAEDLR